MSDIDASLIVVKLAKLVVPNAEADERRRRMEQDQVKAAAYDLWNRAEVPARHADRAQSWNLRNVGGPWVRVCDQVLAMLGKGVTVCLTGNRGNGKTQIAVTAIQATTNAGRTARFITAQRLFMEFKGSFGEGAKRTEVQVLDGFRRPSLLVIDEIGRRSESDWEGRTLFELLNARYNDLTDTIMTANLEPQKLAENVGESIVSRMSEGGGIIECNWQSFRS